MGEDDKLGGREQWKLHKMELEVEEEVQVEIVCKMEVVFESFEALKLLH